MFIAALIIFNFLITIYVVFALAILFHLKKYRWEDDLNIQSAFVFIAGSLFFIILAVYSFITIPWDLI
ncbi:MAG: hypothetical protein A2174_03625 [Candidatus Portnoybacteria bacterium RBG_13_41_18]|uniref:Uncharacterized protein n=1 Tax=Candidatus Portnoybacteria bacterium RBG_13_41_18 TaxID=1801991 RepID=A0A1G2F4H7_9BACT|nr:MAG: hypothetical protein A2174_03625 [Candidatus Portnoybacteria bacterium RBG_13_41_18]